MFPQNRYVSLYNIDDNNNFFMRWTVAADIIEGCLTIFTMPCLQLENIYHQNEPLISLEFLTITLQHPHDLCQNWRHHGGVAERVWRRSEFWYPRLVESEVTQGSAPAPTGRRRVFRTGVLSGDHRSTAVSSGCWPSEVTDRHRLELW